MFNDIIGNISLYDMICYFFIYAFLGWVLEVIYATLKTGKFVNRGFLNGPVCPIYGVGMAIAVLLLNTLSNKWWLLFLAGAALATALEFITGFILDKIFKTKWWDYSKEPLNINGYVCLRFTVLWGIGVVLVFNTVVPLTDKLIEIIPVKWWGIAAISFLTLVITVDFITDIVQLKHLNDKFKEADRIARLIKRDSDAVGGKISEVTVKLGERLKKITANIGKTRIVKAFPSITKRLKDQISERKETKENDKPENGRTV